jgi:hypothetical protein
MITREIRIDSDAGASVSGILDLPSDFEPGVTPGLVIAHGQNNDLRLPLLQDVARFLADSGTACALRFNFPYMERGAERPDGVPVLESAFRSAVVRWRTARFADRASFLGRDVTRSRVAALVAASGLQDNGFRPAGLCSWAFPSMNPAVRSSRDSSRCDRSPRRVCLSTGPAIHSAVSRCLSAGGRAQLQSHGVRCPRWRPLFHVPSSSGRTAEDVLKEIAEQVAAL